MQKLKDLLGILAISLIVVVSLSAQSGVDLTYNALPLKSGTFTGEGQVIQPDGKILVWGGNLVVSGVPSGFAARLNSDGSRDGTFNFCGCGFIAVNRLMLQPDGKILVSGNQDTGGIFFQGRIARINADGSSDNTFIPYQGSSAPSAFLTLQGLQPDGKILAGNYTSSGFPFGASMNVIRLNTGGSRDNPFSIFVGSGYMFMDYLGAIEVLPDGKFYVGIHPSYQSGTATLKRYNADGSVDPTWAAPTFPTGINNINSLDSQPNGDLMVAGGFNQINGVSVKNIARLTSAGTVDPTFVPLNTLSVYQINVLPDGKFLILERLTTSSPSIYAIRRLNSNGSLDGTFVQSPSISNVTSTFSLDGLGRLVFAGRNSSQVDNYYRLNPNGDLDESFAPMFADFGTISAMVKQADNKVIVAGDFTHISAGAGKGLARLNEDGSVDGSFNAGAGFSSPPSNLYIQPDGKILALGHFSSYNGAGVSRLVRINTNGTLDNTFAPVLTSQNNFGVQLLAVQSDGKIVIFGDPFVLNGANRDGLARLNPDGTTDAAFNPVITSTDPNVGGVIVEPNGKLTIGGYFSAVNGVGRQSFARLNADGTLDTSFDPVVDSGTFFDLMVKGGDGKYYYYNNDGYRIGRRNADGSADASFQSPQFNPEVAGELPINGMFPQADGTVIVTGSYIRLSIGQTSIMRHSLVRLKRNGSLDEFFLPSSITGGNGVKGLVELPNNKILIGGDFTLVNNVSRPRLARLNIQPLKQIPNFDFDGDGKADVSVFRPSEGNWYLSQSQNGFSLQNFGLPGDVITPGDFDGDGKADLAIYRPSTGTWWYKSSVNGGFYAVGFGFAGITTDIPLAEDFDGDGKADFVVYRPSVGIWFRLGSTGLYSPITFGQAGDIPQVADFDGDGKADPCIFRPSTGVIWYASSVDGLFYAHPWGLPGDIPVLGDYDGDGKTDPAVFRPSEKFWYIMNSHNASITKIEWGLSDDRPTPADYDGDGKTDIAIYRPSNGMWFAQRSTSGFFSQQFGLSGDKAVPNAFIPNTNPDPPIAKKIARK